MTESKRPNKPDQHARFVEAARALGCDESEEAFDEKLRAIVGPKPDGEDARGAGATGEAKPTK